MGFEFAHTTGNPGPTLTPGTYLVLARALIGPYPGTQTEPSHGMCWIWSTSFDDPWFTQPFALQPNAAGWVSFAGVIVVPDPTTVYVRLECSLSDGTGFSPTTVEWWVSPVGSSTGSGGGGGGGFAGGGGGGGGFGLSGSGSSF